MHWHRITPAVIALLLLTGCKSPQPTYLGQPASIQVQGPYIQAASGMTFPPTLGEFQRATVLQYDVAGLDVGAGYNLSKAAEAVAATVYVYPAPSLISIGSPPDVVASARATLCSHEFERRKKELVDAHPGAALTQEMNVPPPHGGSAIPGKMAAFEYDDLFAGRRQTLHSELHLFCYVGEKWAIAYRFTSPKVQDARGRVSEFMASLPWTVSAKP